MFFSTYIIIELLFVFFNCKNIVLPFKKITIGNFNGQKTLEDLINYNIYTNISIGTPPQEDTTQGTSQDDTKTTIYSFNFQKKQITFGNVKFMPYIKQYEKLSNFWFNETKSSTFLSNDTTLYFSDIFYFENLNEEKILASTIKYSIIDSHLNDDYKCGVIGLNNPDNSDSKLLKAFILSFIMKKILFLITKKI